ncbi:MAG: M20 family metallopeptidase [Actinomycetota bacterium]|nr:M20 family metallopeptidase [Actinomycetota bacterium]
MVGEDVAEPASAAANVAAEAAADATDADEVLRYARALIAAPSENPGGTEDEAADVAIGILTNLGADIQVVRSEEGRPSVVARIGSGERPHLAWNGHLDTVPAGDVSTWSSGPFEGAVVDDRLVGRGACDMKGPIASALAAVAALRRAGPPLAGTLVMHLVADEELAGIHGTRVLRDQGFLDQDAAVVGEPSEMQIALAERGGAWVTAVARGKAAHGSQPDRGINAILTMSRFLLRLSEVLPDRVHPLVGAPTVNVALVAGGSAPNVVPDRCEVEIDRRIVPGEDDPEEVLAPFRRLVDDLVAERPDTSIDISLKDWTEAAETTGDTAIAALVRDAIAAETGSRPPFVGFTGITDARFYINDAGIPTVIAGPGSLSLAHTANESIGVDELVAAARAYARTFVGFLGTR